MADGLNRVMLLGNLGADPELRFTQGGQAVLNMRLATTESYLDKDKVRRERTDWHNVVVWGKRGEGLAKILTKGSSVFIEGSLRTSSYDNKEGQKVYKTEIHANNILLTGSRNRGAEGGSGYEGGGGYEAEGGDSGGDYAPAGGGGYSRGSGGGGSSGGGPVTSAGTSRSPSVATRASGSARSGISRGSAGPSSATSRTGRRRSSTRRRAASSWPSTRSWRGAQAAARGPSPAAAAAVAAAVGTRLAAAVVRPRSKRLRRPTTTMPAASATTTTSRSEGSLNRR